MDRQNNILHFYTLPNTGLQICRRLPVEFVPEAEQKNLWKLAVQQSKRAHASNPVVELLRDHIACDQNVDTTGWIPCDPNPNELVFFRLIQSGTTLLLDLMIDTQNGAGRQVNNFIPCVVVGGFLLFKKSYRLVNIIVTDFTQPKNVVGSLIMDFGNSATSFIFSPSGGGAMDAHPIPIHNPFDPKYDTRPKQGRSMLKSTMTLLSVGESEQTEPWLVLGTRAEELIKEFPLTTCLFAPKKYVRYWPENLRSAEPTTPCRGVNGQRREPHTMMRFVQYTIDHMLQTVISSLTNPRFASRSPEFYPQVNRIMLTYPLTWREVERKLFQNMIEKSAARLLMLDAHNKASFQVELACSEPVAVAIYILWECFFHYGSRNLHLAANSLGNVLDMPELRILVIDIGGGSTDIALIRTNWEVRDPENPIDVDVLFQVVESMRFNRAGDRISHIIATALVQFLEQKYGVKESLDYGVLSANPGFTMHYKRQAISKLSDLVERAKIALVEKARLMPRKFAVESTFQPQAPVAAVAPAPAQPKTKGGLVGAIRQAAKEQSPQANPAVLKPPGNDEPTWLLTAEDERELLTYFAPLNLDSWEQKIDQSPRFELSLRTLQEWLCADQASTETKGEPGFMDIFYYLEELRTNLQEISSAPHLVILSGRTTRLPFFRDLVSKHLGMPFHRIRTLDELLPDALKGPEHQDMDKLAVVCGAQRLRYGDPIRFIPLPPEPVFKRYLGTVRETPSGLRLNNVLIRPGDRQPRTVSIEVDPAKDLRIGSAFRENGPAEVIASLSNGSANVVTATIDLVDDYHVVMAKTKSNANLVLSEWVPGGNKVIVDNFNDTGKIDLEPEGFIRKIVKKNEHQWFKKEIES